MIALNTLETRDVLLDALTDPQVSDHLKYMILQAMTAAYDFKPYDADIGGRLVRLADFWKYQKRVVSMTKRII